MENLVVISTLESIEFLLEKNTETLHHLMEKLPSSAPENSDIIQIMIQLLKDQPDKLEPLAETFVHWCRHSGTSSFELPLNRSDDNLLSQQKSPEESKFIKQWRSVGNSFDQIWRERLRQILPETSSTSTSRTSQSQRLHCIKCYCILFNNSDVWRMYKHVRKEQTLIVLSQHSFIALSNRLGNGNTKHELHQILCTMMKADVEIAHEIGRNYSIKDANDTFLDVLTDHVESILKETVESGTQVHGSDVTNYNGSRSPGSKDVVLLSLNEETGSTESCLSKPILESIVELVKNCWALECSLRDTLEETTYLKNETEQMRSCGDTLKPKPNKEIVNKSTSHFWDWRFLFIQYSSDLSQLVEENIRTIVLSSIEQECLRIQHFKQLESVDLCPALGDTNSNFPRQISAAISSITEMMDDSTPLALACRTELSAVKNSFVITLKQYVGETINHLLKLSQENILSQNKSNRCLILSSTTYIMLKLENLNTLLDENENMSLKGECVRLAELVETLVQQMKLFHKTLLMTSIFHDRDSHNWKSNKPFYEDERFSFSIKMWCIHMQALHTELTTLSPMQSHQIFTTVLSFSLSWFTQRYARIKPSFAHVNQFRADITAILLGVSDFVYTTNFQISRNSSENPDLTAIHAHCKTLLAILAIITSPIHVLYKEFKLGYSINDIENEVESSSACWLNVIQPSLWSTETVQTGKALGVTIKTMCSQFAPHWPTAIHLLLDQDCTLPFMLLCHITAFPKSQGKNVLMDQCRRVMCEERSLCSTGQVDLMKAVIIVLGNCNAYPQALSNVLVKLIHRFDQWNVFTSFTAHDFEIPYWFKIILEVMKPVYISIISPILQKIFEIPNIDWDQITQMSEKLPVISLNSLTVCRCNISSMVTELFRQLFLSVIALAAPLRELFALIQKEMPIEERKKLIAKSPFVHMSIMQIRYLMTSFDELETLVGKIGRHEKILLTNIADELVSPSHLTNDYYSALQKAFPAPMILNDFESSLELETLCGILAAEVTANEEASIALVQFYKLVIVNQSWISANLGITTEDDVVDNPVLQTKLNKARHQKFSPFGSHKHWLNDHKKVLNFQFDWQQMLKSRIGLSLLSFRLLLNNRWEMQNGAQLDENEEKPVQELKSQFSFDTNVSIS